MEVKDVNNSGLLNLLQANRSVLPGGSAGMSGFSDLLSGLENNREAAVEKSPEFATRKNASLDNVKVAVKEKQPAAEKRSDAKADKPLRKASENVEKNTVKSSEDKNQVAAENTSKENASAKNNAEEVETAEFSGEDMGAERDTADVMEVSLDALALMGTVSVVNPINGEIFQVSGEDLAAQLAGAGIDDVVVEVSSEMVLVKPASDAQADMDAFKEVLRAMQPASGDMVEALATETAVSAVKPVKDVVAGQGTESVSEIEAQAAELSKVVGENHKVKMEVSVKAEKIADLVDRDLMTAQAVSNEVVLPEGEGEASNPLIDSSVLAEPSTNNQAATQVKNTVLASVAAAGGVTSAVSAETAPAVVAENATVSLASSGATGSEMLANARPAPANDGASSFRDVYKGMGREVVEQIKVNITKSAVKGVDTIEIQLKPEDLGKIEVKMQIGKDGKLQAHIVSGRPETAEILQKEMANLQKAFEEAGFQTDEGSLSFSFRDDGQAGREQERNNLRSFIGNALEQETVMDTAGNDLFAGTAWDGTGGLNIRV